MCLRFVFLLITRVAAGLQLSRREETWKTAEILILRHQLAVLQRQSPIWYLRFVFLLITRVAAGLQLSRREETWKTAEILILRHQLAVLQRREPRRPKLNWADRALLATLLGVIPKARRQGLRLLITPDTIVRWHRDIVRRHWAARSKRGRTGRPAARHSIRRLVCPLARENPDWGYRRIHGELAGLGVKVAASTVWEILKASGIDPGRRQTGLTWSQ